MSWLLFLCWYYMIFIYLSIFYFIYLIAVTLTTLKLLANSNIGVNLELDTVWIWIILYFFCMPTVFNFIIDIVTLYYLQYNMGCVIFLWVELLLIISKHLTWQKANLKLGLPFIVSDSYLCSVLFNIAELLICIALHTCVAQDLDALGIHFMWRSGPHLLRIFPLLDIFSLFSSGCLSSEFCWLIFQTNIIASLQQISSFSIRFP